MKWRALSTCGNGAHFWNIGWGNAMNRERCPNCKGMGQILAFHPYGCPACAGKGYIIRCENCGDGISIGQYERDGERMYVCYDCANDPLEGFNER